MCPVQYLFYDLEFAKCTKTGCNICSFGYVLTNNKFKVLEKNDILINPNSNWDEYVLRYILAYDKQSFETQPTFDAFYPKIASLMQNKNTIVFGFDTNGSDMKALQYNCKRYNLKPIACNTYYDIQTLYKLITHNKEASSLYNIAQSLHINTQHLTLHNSCDDAELSMLILKKLARKKLFGLKPLLKMLEQT